MNRKSGKTFIKLLGDCLLFWCKGAILKRM